ncbi:MAG TPA: hypothetical protein PKY78_06455 [Candidatus Omnitrophota bacterium]|nr:hypothetical protein [Candidatus Omnitrophota bacterium]HPS20609.1 hypothetical protein [Candidatus Omnitrophota bacterium]
MKKNKKFYHIGFFALIWASIVCSAYAMETGDQFEIQETHKLKWRGLTAGMTMDYLRKEIGEPSRVVEENGAIRWEYPKGGYLTFVDGKLIDCKEPRSWD